MTRMGWPVLVAIAWTILLFLMLPTLVQGIAMAFFFIPLTTMTLSGLPPQRIPAASGLTNFVRISAGAMGTSITTTIWDDRAALHHAHLVEAASRSGAAAGAAIDQMVAGGMTQEQALASLQRLIDQQAHMLGANDVFFASALIFVGLIALVWLARPIRGGTGGPEAGGAH